MHTEDARHEHDVADLPDGEARRELWNGFGAGLAIAFELAFTPGIFAAIGYGIDRWLGWVPAFTITLFVFALIGMFVKLWISYDAEMRRHEARSVWGRGDVPAEARPV